MQPPDRDQTANAPAETDEPLGLFCPVCGAAIRTDAARCPECGTESAEFSTIAFRAKPNRMARWIARLALAAIAAGLIVALIAILIGDAEGVPYKR